MMAPLGLDYCRTRTRSRAGAYALAGAIVFAVHVGMEYRAAREQAMVSEAALVAAMRPAARPAQPRVDEQQFSFARDTIERVSTPWSELFRALEEANTERIALLSIEPNAETRTVLVTGEARDYLATLTYVARLAEQEQLQRVHLLRHDTRGDAPRRPVVFSISAAWKGEH